MADDWQVGDLALCVNTGRIVCPGCGCICTGEWCPPLGSVRQVIAVSACSATDPIDDDDDCAALVLIFAGFCGDVSRFRKLRPHEEDAEDRETIRLLSELPARTPSHVG